MDLILLAFILTVVLVSCFWLTRRKRIRRNSPPGPIGLPIVGHLPFLGTHPFKTFLKWKKIYGPIFSLQYGSLPAVVVNDSKIIKELFSRNALAERPHADIYSEISWGYKGLIFGLARTALEQRHFILKNFKDLGVGKKTMEEKIMDEVNDFVKTLEDEVATAPPGGQPIPMNHRFQASVINSTWSMLMSRRFERSDPLFNKIREAAEISHVSAGVLGEMAMFMPWLAKLVSKISGLDKKVKGFHDVYSFVENEISKHNATRIPQNPRDFTDAYLDKVEETVDPTSTFHKTQNFQPVSTGDIFLGALDTTSTALEWMIIHLVRNPKVQNQIYEEVSRVTSENSRLPNLNDRVSMPYTDACVHELLRISTIGLMGLPHFTLEDTPVQGYTIPKGTMVISNLYGIHHDPENFEDPDEFRPDRFLEKKDGCLKVKKNVDGYLPFSYGKRFCPGQRQALDNIFLFTTALVQKFEFGCWANEMPTLDVNFGMVGTPHTFRVKVGIRLK